MNEGSSLLSAPVAILIGSVIISFSILVAGGIIIGKGQVAGVKTVQPAPSQIPGQVAQPQAKTEADIIKNLKIYASKLDLDQKKFNSCLDSGEKASLVSADQSDGVTSGVQGTPSYFVNGRPLAIGAAPFSEFKKVIDEELSGSAPANTERKNVAVGNLPVLGQENAPVTFIEFSDYQCPFCGRFHQQAEVQIKKEYVDAGKLKIYFRDFPLTQIHPGAQKAAEAARCAADQGKFWEYNNLVFDNQSKIF